MVANRSRNSSRGRNTEICKGWSEQLGAHFNSAVGLSALQHGRGGPKFHQQEMLKGTCGLSSKLREKGSEYQHKVTRGLQQLTI